MISDMTHPRPAGMPQPGAEPAADPLSAPTRAQIEQACRGMPATPNQQSWAISRPAPRRVPRPKVGDEVLYRHDSWLDPVPAEIIWVQPDDDVDDPNVCQVQSDGHGGVVLLEGRPVFISNPDAWLRVHLRIDSAVPEIGNLVADTREARLPGSPGWLPLDWQDRWRPMPWEV